MGALRRGGKRQDRLAAVAARVFASPGATSGWSLRCAVAAFAAVLALACVVGAGPAWAGTPYVDGISDQNLGLWNGDYVDSSGAFSMPVTSFFAGSWGGNPSRRAAAARRTSTTGSPTSRRPCT